MSVKTVLVPLDESVLAEAALPYAEAIVAATGARLRLLVVVEREPRGLLGGKPEVQRYLEQVSGEAKEQYLKRTAAALKDRGVSAATTIAHGDPVDEILAAADEDPDAIVVMATRGRGGIDRWLVGSVADKVMRLSTRPVLLVRPPEAEEARGATALHRVMLPLDGSKLSEAALPLAAEIARALGVGLVLVRVEPWLAAMAPAYGYLPDVGRMDEEAAEAARGYLKEARRRLPEGIHTQTIVLRGAPAEQLVSFARNEGIDLVVMSTHGAGGLRRLVLGSIADRMVRTGVPTLLVRPPAPASPIEEAPTVAPARHCATCRRLILLAVDDDTRCPRCRTHLHTCANCVFWDEFACVLQRPEAHDRAWAGHGCPRFIFRETAEPSRTAARP